MPVCYSFHLALLHRACRMLQNHKPKTTSSAVQYISVKQSTGAVSKGLYHSVHTDRHYTITVDKFVIFSG